MEEELLSLGSNGSLTPVVPPVAVQVVSLVAVRAVPPVAAQADEEMGQVGQLSILAHGPSLASPFIEAMPPDSPAHLIQMPSHPRQAPP
jgi:hypothetical protein